MKLIKSCAGCSAVFVFGIITTLLIPRAMAEETPTEVESVTPPESEAIPDQLIDAGRLYRLDLANGGKAVLIKLDTEEDFSLMKSVASSSLVLVAEYEYTVFISGTPDGTIINKTFRVKTTTGASGVRQIASAIADGLKAVYHGEYVTIRGPGFK